jgi:hypothetical protein
MNTISTITSDKLADIGRALYGERWQTALAADLRVADRTLRRWLTGEAPIPDNIGREARELLTKRIDKMGGIVVYSVHPANRIVFHHLSGASFQYDENGNVTLLPPILTTADNIWLITLGAQEALRQEYERNQRGVGFAWMQKGGQLVSSDQMEEEYKDCVITYPRIPMFSGRWTVNLASNNRNLLAKLGGNVVINSHVSLEEAIKEAKRRVDELT